VVDRLLDLSGPHAALAWVALATCVVGIATVLLIAATNTPPRAGTSLLFNTTFVAVYLRIAFRQVTPDASLTYWGAVIYALPGLACVLVAVDIARHRGDARPDALYEATKRNGGSRWTKPSSLP